MYIETKEMDKELNAMQVWYKKDMFIPISDDCTNLEEQGETIGACWCTNWIIQHGITWILIMDLIESRPWNPVMNHLAP